MRSVSEITLTLKHNQADKAVRSLLDEGVPPDMIFQASERLERQVRREMAKSDLFYLVTGPLGYNPRKNPDFVEFGDLHLRMAREMEARNPWTMFMWARGFCKSTFLIGRIVQDIIRDPDTAGMIASFSADKAMETFSEVKEHFTVNEEFRELFPEFVTRYQNYGDEENFQVPNRTRPRAESTLTVGSVKKNLVRAHYDFIDYDDIVVRDSVYDNAQIEKGISWFRDSLHVTRARARRQINGTRWAENETYGWIIENEMNRRKAGRGE
ncbi:MAG: hypothetical protein ACREH5_07825, partial [Candidatus Omnitrophota bacterium]